MLGIISYTLCAIGLAILAVTMFNYVSREISGELDIQQARAFIRLAIVGILFLIPGVCLILFALS